MKKLFYLLFAVFAISACSKDGDNDTEKPTVCPPPEPETELISFEPAEHLLNAATGSDVVLGDVTMSLYNIGNYTYKNIFCAKAYAADKDFDGILFSTADSRVKFSSYYSSQYDTWGGVALAQLPDMKAAAMSYTQQFSVWADCGANGTPTYAVFYDSNSPSEGYGPLTKSGYPTIDLTTPREIDHFYIANSTLVYNYFKGEDADSYQVKITGWQNGTEKGSVTETLVAGKSKLAGWRKVSLASFGKVDKVVFKVICNYAADPCFFCVDEITLKKSAE